MPKPSEIFDTPEAISRVGGNNLKEQWETVTWNVLSSVQTGRLSLKDAQDKLDALLTTKDTEIAEAVKAERSRIYGRLAQMKSVYETMDTGSALVALMEEDIIREEALPTEDNN